MNKFALFSECIHQLETNPAIKKFDEAVAAADAIRQGQRFFLPSGRDLMDGKAFEDMPPVHCPFPITAILSSELQNGAEHDTISIFASKDGINTVILSLLKTEGSWCVWPAASVEISESGKHLIGISKGPLYQVMKRGGCEIGPMEYSVDMKRLVNLSLMLSLANVKTESVNPDSKANHKRRNRGAVPLYSYKILNVDGERWDSNGVDMGDGQGYRSHLRRGHIRRISGDHAVWVRATYVHGRIPGFVDKDYNVVAA